MSDKRLNRLFIAMLLMGSSFGVLANETDRDVRIIKMEARRYEYIPNILELKPNQKVELHILSRDVLHGFHIPGLGIRADLNPGQLTIVKLSSLPAGEYPFMCDIFCGTQHSSMHGKLIVK